MRAPGLLLLLGGLAAADAVTVPVPAPATVIATDNSGPSASARAIESTLAADRAWAAARKQAEQQAQAHHSAATKATGFAAATRGAEPEPPALTPGGLATWAGQDEVALLLELRRRRLANGSQAADLVAAELAATLTSIDAHLPSTNRTPSETGTVAHPGDEPHPGPRAPVPTDAPDRPERFPAR